MKLILPIIVIIIFLSCKRYENFVERIEDDFTLSITDSTGVVNDGKATVKIKIENTKEVKEGLKVNFTTNKGSFLFNDVRFENHKAETFLKVDQDTGMYVVKAQLKDGESVRVEKQILFSFRRANPDNVAMQVNRTLYSLTMPTTITTYLLRNTGLVTKGTSAIFRAFQVNATNDTILVGRFEGLLNNVSDASGKLADIKLYTDDPLIDTSRAIIIQAKVINDNRDTVRRNHIMEFN